MDRPLHLAADEPIPRPEFAICIDSRLSGRHRRTPGRGRRQLLLHAGLPELRLRHRDRRLAIRCGFTRSAGRTPAHSRHHGLLAGLGLRRLPRRHGGQSGQRGSGTPLDVETVAAGACPPGRNAPGSGARFGMGQSPRGAARRLRHGLPAAFRAVTLPRPVPGESVFLRLGERRHQGVRRHIPKDAHRHRRRRLHLHSVGQP